MTGAMPENWNGLITLSDLQYAAASLGFDLFGSGAPATLMVLRTRRDYWIDDCEYEGNRAEICAYLLGFNAMRSLHHKMRNRDIEAIKAVLCMTP